MSIRDAWSELLAGNYIKVYLSNGDTRSGTLEEFWLTTDGCLLNITIRDKERGETITINGDHIMGYVSGPAQ